ncbi:hypothetical protein BH24ACT5_BH24ACT5_12370 [soil metagenome]
MDDARFDVVVIGDVNPDLVLADDSLSVEFDQHEAIVERGVLTLGGSSAITACGAARLGLRTALAGVIGDDLFGHWCRGQLASYGVDTTLLVVDPGVHTAITVILQRRDDRAIVSTNASHASLGLAHLDLDVLRRARHVHVGSYFLLDTLRPDLPTLLADVRSHGTTTSLDTNFDPAGGWDVDGVLDHCDIFLPNEAEARRFGRSDVLDDAVAALVTRVGVVAVTLGAAGALVASRNFCRREPAPVLDGDVVDAVGAGDTFDAGFIAGHLLGLGPDRSLQLALGAAALSVRGQGGVDRQGTLDEAMAAGGVEP